MKILYLHNKTNISGGEQSLINLWRTLNKESYTAIVVIPQPGLLGEAAKNIGLFVDYCNVPKLLPRNILGIIKALYKIWSICIIEKVDIIHSYAPRNNILASITGKILRIPVVWHERNMIFGDERDISKILLFLPEVIICNSKAVASRFKKRGKLPSKVKTIINGVDTQKFRPGEINSEIIDKYGLHGNKVVGLLSNLGNRKQPEYFIKACPHILKEQPQTMFLIVGGEFDKQDKGRRHKLELMAMDLGVSKHVIFTGYLPEVEEIIRVFDIGVAVTEKEACSRALLEMMSSGKPVVAFDTGGNPELIKHNETGILINTGNVQKLSGEIINLLKDDIERELMGKRARERVKRDFKITFNTAQTTEIYSILNR